MIGQPAQKVFQKQAELFRQGMCVFCNKPVKEKEFTDNLSKEEYIVSGLCQRCQDKVFE